MELSILIATINDRKTEFQKLFLELLSQVKSDAVVKDHDIAEGKVIHAIGESVEIIALRDNRELPIGQKRQKLLELASGRFIVYFDDDDWPSESYIESILGAIKDPAVDCVGIKVNMTTNGNNIQTCLHRFRHPMIEGKQAKRYGVDYVRPITHFNPVLREKALRAGFGNERYGEDVAYWKRLNPLLTKEYFIPSILFHYRYSTEVPHNKKYGIK